MPVLNTKPLTDTWKSEQASVLDPAWKKALRPLMQLLGADDPQLANMVDPSVGMMLTKAGVQPMVASAIRSAPEMAPWKTAYEWFLQKYPRLARHVDLLGSPPEAKYIASFREYPAGVKPEIGEKTIGAVSLADDVFKPGREKTSGLMQRAITGLHGMPRSDEQAVQIMGHELNHVANYLQNPRDSNALYRVYQRARGYEFNPMEGASELTGGRQQARFMAERGASADDVEHVLHQTAQRGRSHLFPYETDVADSMMWGQSPEDKVRGMQRIMRAITNFDYDRLAKDKGGLDWLADKMREQNRTLMPDVVRGAILGKLR